MIPIGFDVKGDIIFKYRFSDLREFITEGRLNGDVGFIAISKDSNNIIKYKGFGTIEHPCKEIHSISMKYNKDFDGEFNPFQTHRRKTNMSEYRYELLDLGPKKK